MGLTKRSEQGLISRIKAATIWHFAGALAFISIAVGVTGDAGRDWLKYDRLAIENGEYWRLLSAHFTHLGAAHLWLNMVALLLTWLLVGRFFTVPEWLLITGLSLLTQSLGFWFLDVNLLWYVGMSGLLHGLMLAGAIRGFRTLRTESAILFVLVVAKLIYEQLLGPLPGSESASGGSVVVNAHLYGAIGGALAAIAIWRRGQDRASI